MDQSDVNDGHEEQAAAVEGSEVQPVGGLAGLRDYGPEFMRRLLEGLRPPGSVALEAGADAAGDAVPPMPSFVDYGDHLRGQVQDSDPTRSRSSGVASAPGPIRRL